jgi:dipicolinate synthase subunit A
MKMVIYCAGSTKACQYAAEFLQGSGHRVVDAPCEEVTHLLLDVPSFGAKGLLRSGEPLDGILSSLPETVTVWGGNLHHASLEGYRKMDLLQDAFYLAENAYITAECALDVALPYLDITIRNCPVLIVGWGRIGKCLGQLLKNMGAEVTISARKEADRAMIQTLGYTAMNTGSIEDLDTFLLIFNTVPGTVLTREQMALCHGKCVKIDLASELGMEGEDVIVARGLPGIHFPESSGKLIAATILRLCGEDMI